MYILRGKLTFIPSLILFLSNPSSETSLQLAKHLKPAYIRLAGASTEFVKYQDEEQFFVPDSTSVALTPSVWFGINEWLRLTQLIPIFGINDIETVKDVWNPKSILPLLEISDKLNVNCLWQLGFGKLVIDIMC